MMQLSIENTSIWMDIKSVFESNKKPIIFNITGILHTEKENIPILKISTLDIVRDYASNISDTIFIEFKIPLGDYVNRFYPHRSNLELTIKKEQLTESGGVREKNTIISVEKFKAVFLNKENPDLEGSDLSHYSTAELNLRDILEVKLQLLNRSIEPLRIKTVSGIFRNVTQKQLIYNIMSGESNKVLIEGKPSIDGVDIVEPDNKVQLNNVIIKSGTNLSSIPTYLQNNSGGVYNASIGTYLQTFNSKKYWFIYPLYNTNRFNNNVEKIIFYSVVGNRLKGIDKTYNKEGLTTKILVTGNKRFRDNTDTESMNEGIGFKVSNAKAFMKKPVHLTKDGPKGARVNLNYEVINKERKDGLNYAPVSSNNITSNPYTEYSKVNSRTVTQIDLIWENANSDIIYPGMPCMYVYLENNKPIQLKGVILFVHSFTSLQGTGIINNTYRSMCTVSIIAEKKPL
jgi:hypothetical protein